MADRDGWYLCILEILQYGNQTVCVSVFRGFTMSRNSEE